MGSGGRDDHDGCTHNHVGTDDIGSNDDSTDNVGTNDTGPYDNRRAHDNCGTNYDSCANDISTDHDVCAYNHGRSDNHGFTDDNCCAYDNTCSYNNSRPDYDLSANNNVCSSNDHGCSNNHLSTHDYVRSDNNGGTDYNRRAHDSPTDNHVPAYNHDGCDGGSILRSRKPMKQVSAIIANRNDTVMLAITVRSLIESMQGLDFEIVICDNSDADIVPMVEAVIPVRYIRDKTAKLIHQDFPCLFTAREAAAREATGKYIFCVDSHCLIGNNTVQDAFAFAEGYKDDDLGFIHTPVNWLCQHEGASRHDMQTLLGSWGRLYDKPREINWKGMPWLCNREWFLGRLGGYGALSENRVSWGGGDMYLGVKTWMLGYKNMAVPARPVIHIGPLPEIVRSQHQYRLYSKSGDTENYFGFMIALFALGADHVVSSERFAEFMKMKFGFEMDEDKVEKAKALAQNDRAVIESKATYAYRQLEDSPPWEDTEDEYYNALLKYRSVFNDTQKSIKPDDWPVFLKTIKANSIASVLEFGTGVSTIAMEAIGLSVVSFETDNEYIKKVRPLTSGNVFLWDNEALYLTHKHKFDMGVVDGALPRKRSAEIAKELCRVVIVHDGRRRQCGFDAAELFMVDPNWEEETSESRLVRVFRRKQ